MRQWYEIDFTPDHAINKSKHFDWVTNLVIDGTLFNTHLYNAKRATLNEFENMLLKQLANRCVAVDSITMDDVVKTIEAMSEKYTNQLYSGYSFEEEKNS